MTQISLTENLKKIALQQYHPHIDIDLWSLEQENYENENHVFVNSKFQISKEDFESLFDENEFNAQYDIIQITPPNTTTIYKDGIYQNTNDNTLSFSIDGIPNKLYFVCLRSGSFNLNIRYYVNNNANPNYEDTINFSTSKDYRRFRLNNVDITDGFDEDLSGFSIDAVTSVEIILPSNMIYIGDIDDKIILDDDSYVQFTSHNLPDSLTFSSSVNGSCNIRVDFFEQNNLHPNEDPELITSTEYSIEIFEEIERLNMEIAQNDITNVKIIENDIGLLLSSNKDEYKSYINSDYNNIIFTPNDNLDIIIPYEYYKGVFYLRLPRFYRTISMHLLPKNYDASDDVVLFQTEDIISSINSENKNWISADSTYRSPNKVDIHGTSYGRYLIPLPEFLKSSESIEIDVFSKYNSFSANAHDNHQIGIIDTDNRGFDSAHNRDKYAEEMTLIYNKQESQSTSLQIITATRTKENINLDNAFRYSSASNALSSIATNTPYQQNYNYESIIKYHNDSLYIEEYNPRASNAIPNRKAELQTNNKYNYMTSEWPYED